MSSSSPPSTTSLNYWCYVCDGSISLPSPTSPIRCPQCMHEFLADRPPTPPPPPPPSHFHYRSRSFSSSSSSSPSPPSSPSHAAQAYLRRIIRQISSDDSGPIPIPIRRGPAPASPSAISAIPAVQVSEPSIPCAICKDEFAHNSEARCLPCSHLYHSDCIIPWLQLRNSCPVCRSQIPSSCSEPELPPSPPVGTTTHVSIQFRTLFDGVDSEEGGGTGARALRVALRQITRRNRPRVRRAEVSLSQLAQEETGGASGPANSAETVSSGWPAPVVGGFGGAAVSTGTDEDGDTVMSEARDGFF